MDQSGSQKSTEFDISGQGELQSFAAKIADWAAPGHCVLLEGPVGAGKTALARAVIQNLLARVGLREDIPSPTFTLVQTYEADELEIWHADLYRLTNADELAEIGLDEALSDAFCLIEWPDRLPDGMRSQSVAHVRLAQAEDDESRRVTVEAPHALLSDINSEMTVS